MIRPVARTLALIALLAIAAGPALAQRPEPRGVVPARITAGTAVDLKMDAALRTAIERYAEVAAAAKAGARAMPDAAALFPPTIPYRLVSGEFGGEPLASVFVKLDRPQSIEALTAAGATVVLQQENLALVRIPVSRVKEAALSSGVRAMSLAKRWEADLDSSRIRTRVKDVQSGAGTLPQPYLGDGVIVGALDSGLDYTHADFRNSASDSRLLALFDYAQGANGVECRPGQLDSLTCGVIDGSGGHGHGTHVTGIAAGNGRLNPQYTGMAPHADLLFVKGIRDAQSNGGFSDDDVMNGTGWMLGKALAVGKPIAVNLSLGSQFGAHDGTSLQEQFLDSFVGPGRIIVAAAGNSSGDTIHAGYATQGNDYQTGLETPILLGTTSALVDLWAPAGSNIRVGFAAYNNGLI